MTFISDDFAEMMDVPTESLLRNIWQPSVFSIEMVGTAPRTLKNERIEFIF